MAETKLRVADEIYALLGFNDSENRVRSGLLAEGTMAQIRDAIARLLISHGIQASDAISVGVSDLACLTFLATLRTRLHCYFPSFYLPACRSKKTFESVEKWEQFWFCQRS